MEYYKTIKDFETYEISNFGNVRNVKTGRIMKTNVNKDGYYRLNIRNDEECKFFILRLVAQTFIPNPENKPLIDHIDGNVKNNNVSNLRWATHSENGINKKMNPKNKTGYTGVKFDKRYNNYRSQISYNNKNYNLGTFDNIEDAVNARLLKSEELFKEFQSNHEKELTLKLKINPKITKLNLEIDYIVDDEGDNWDEELKELIKEIELKGLKEYQEFMNKK